MKTIAQRLKEYHDALRRANRSDITSGEMERILSRMGHIKTSLHKAIDSLPKT